LRLYIRERHRSLPYIQQRSMVINEQEVVKGRNKQMGHRHERVGKKNACFFSSKAMCKNPSFIDHPLPVFSAPRTKKDRCKHQLLDTTTSTHRFISSSDTPLGSAAETTTSVSTTSGGTTTARWGLVSATRCGRGGLAILTGGSGPALAGCGGSRRG
jgi:hypothetical protein